MQLSDEDARRRFGASRVARLATVRPGGAPHVVPVVFAVVGDVVYTPIDHKPKRSTRLQRLANLRAEPRCALLADGYDEDWSRLWWARADGRATVLDEPDRGHPGVAALVGRYEQYRTHPPTGPLVEITVARWRGWAAEHDDG